MRLFTRTEEHKREYCGTRYGPRSSALGLGLLAEGVVEYGVGAVVVVLAALVPVPRPPVILARVVADLAVVGLLLADALGARLRLFLVLHRLRVAGAEVDGELEVLPHVVHQRLLQIERELRAVTTQLHICAPIIIKVEVLSKDLCNLCT